MNCYNEAKYVGQALDSLFGQTFQDWELIFWDNASTDESAEIAKSYGDRVRYYRSESMTLLATARRLAYEQTRAPYIAILDADDIWMPQKLERQLELFRSDQQLGLVYCDAIYFTDKGDSFRLFKLAPPHRGEAFGQLLDRNFIFSSAMMFNRRALEAMELAFDERFTRAPDYELSLRISYLYPIDYVDEPLMKWRMYELSDKPWKKDLVSREEEVIASVENLISMYPEIKTRYADELRRFYKQLDYSSGITAWQNGKPAEARKYLSRHLLSKKFAFVYLCTLLTSFDFFYKCRNKYKSITVGGS